MPEGSKKPQYSNLYSNFFATSHENMDFVIVLTQKSQGIWILFVYAITTSHDFGFSVKFYKKNTKRQVSFSGPVFPITTKKDTILNELNGCCISNKIMKELLDDGKLHYTLIVDKN